MEIALLILAFLCMLVGIVGCIIPGLPGTPIAYAGLWIAQATDRVDFSWQFMLIWGIVVVVVSVLDYIVPAWGTKQGGPDSAGSLSRLRRSLCDDGGRFRGRERLRHSA